MILINRIISGTFHQLLTFYMELSPHLSLYCFYGIGFGFDAVLRSVFREVNSWMGEIWQWANFWSNLRVMICIKRSYNKFTLDGATLNVKFKNLQNDDVFLKISKRWRQLIWMRARKERERETSIFSLILFSFSEVLIFFSLIFSNFSRSLS